MFDKNTDERLTAWVALRTNAEKSKNCFDDIWQFWQQAPFTPYNPKIDPYFQRNWPSPWEIIAQNIYDDFTKALMIGWTIKLTNKFKDSKVELRTCVDKNKNSVYNVVIIDEDIVINYDDNGPIRVTQLPDSISVENFIELDRPR